MRVIGWARVGGYEPRNDLLWALTGVVAVLTSFHLNPHDLTLLYFRRG